MTQNLPTGSGGQTNLTMPTFLAHAGDSRAGVQKRKRGILLEPTFWRTKKVVWGPLEGAPIPGNRILVGAGRMGSFCGFFVDTNGTQYNVSIPQRHQQATLVPEQRASGWLIEAYEGVSTIRRSAAKGSPDRGLRDVLFQQFLSTDSV